LANRKPASNNITIQYKGDEMILPRTIEQMLHSRQKNPVATLELIKDICRRIKILEKKGFK
jgi:predicted RNA binding protein YcfA (HicA-like mRNA interferase family)